MLDVNVDLNNRRYDYHNTVQGLEVIALKTQDIPDVMARGMADFAIASDEWIEELDVTSYRSLVPLCWYHARLCVLAPADGYTVFGGVVSVATSYPNLTRRFLGDEVSLHPASGSVEVYPGRLTSLAVDCVESGLTAHENNLVVMDEIRRCDVRLICSPHVDIEGPTSRRLIQAAKQLSANPDCTYSTAPVRQGSRW